MKKFVLNPHLTQFSEYWVDCLESTNTEYWVTVVKVLEIDLYLQQ